MKMQHRTFYVADVTEILAAKVQHMIFREWKVCATLIISIMLGFGKHVGKTLEQVSNEDKEYTLWLSGFELVNNNGTLYIVRDGDRISFGKHNGKTWSEIRTNDPGYADQLENIKKEDGTTKFAFAVQKLREVPWTREVAINTAETLEVPSCIPNSLNALKYGDEYKKQYKALKRQAEPIRINAKNNVHAYDDCC